MEDCIEGSFPTKHKNIRCCMCGFWITKYEFGGFIQGKAVDFVNKDMFEISVTFCHECMIKLMEYTGVMEDGQDEM